MKRQAIGDGGPARRQPSRKERDAGKDNCTHRQRLERMTKTEQQADSWEKQNNATMVADKTQLIYSFTGQVKFESPKHNI